MEPKMKKCPHCQTEMFYNSHYHCFECSECDRTYNYSLQELRPIDEWQHEFDEDDY